MVAMETERFVLFCIVERFYIADSNENVLRSDFFLSGFNSVWIFFNSRKSVFLGNELTARLCERALTRYRKLTANVDGGSQT
jgi:hypothetical protein